MPVEPKNKGFTGISKISEKNLFLRWPICLKIARGRRGAAHSLLFCWCFLFLGGSNFRAIEFKVECLVFAFSARHLTRQAPLGATDNRQGREPLLQSILRQLAPSGRQTMCRAGLTASLAFFSASTLSPHSSFLIPHPSTLNLVCFHHFPHPHFPLSLSAHAFFEKSSIFIVVSVTESSESSECSEISEVSEQISEGDLQSANPTMMPSDEWWGEKAQHVSCTIAVWLSTKVHKNVIERSTIISVAM